MSKQTHTGSCHCGAVKYEFDADVTEAFSCNCSMCHRAGTLLHFVAETDFRLLAGEDQLISYHFNKHIIDHNFCKTCGLKSFAKGRRRDGSPMRAVNVRCVDGLDIAAIKITPVDGKSF